MYKNVPEALKKLNQWVCWSLLPDESRPGHMKKMPINPHTGGNAMSNNPMTWSTFEFAVQESHKYSGIGIVFANGIFGVDIDNCREELDEYRAGDYDNTVGKFVHTLQSYAETSPSGNGIHIICKGELPDGGRRKGRVEMYQTGRFFTVTGDAISDYSLRDCTEEIKALHEEHVGGGNAPTLQHYTAPLDLSDSDVLKAIASSRQADAYQTLHSGRWQGLYNSQSEADLAYCNMLAFWCRRDEAQMDRIFRTSALMRPKWDRRAGDTTYGAATIQRAIAGCRNVYEPKQQFSITIDQPKAPPKVYSLDDTGNAERFTDAFGDSIRWSYVAKKWMYYDGRRWVEDMTGQAKRMADEVIDRMRLDYAHAEDEEAEKALAKHIKLTRNNKGKENMLKEAQHGLPILPNVLDTHTDMLNAPNGTINLRTGELMKHDPERYITKIIHVEYTDKIDYPLWESFLRQIFREDEDLIRYIQKAIGYSLSGSTQEHCAFFCYGTGRNGKSTFLDTISEILGDYAINIQPETIMVKQLSSGPSSDIARLKGARFVTSVEPGEGMRLNEGLLKQLTGGDRVTACKKYENEFEFSPEFKLWMGTNHKPIIRGTDTGIWSRMRLIPFDVQIPDDKIDRRLKYKLRQEAQGILKWAVDGCLLWQREGLTPPAAVLDATKEYRGEMDVLVSFLEECTAQGPGDELSSALYQAYAKWADENNEYKMGHRKFGVEISKRFTKKHKSNGWYYQGIRLNREYVPYKGVSFGTV